MIRYSIDTTSSRNIYSQNIDFFSTTMFLFAKKKEKATHTYDMYVYIYTRTSQSNSSAQHNMTHIVLYLCFLYEKWKRYIRNSADLGSFRLRIDYATEVYKRFRCSLAIVFQKKNSSEIVDVFANLVSLF